MKESDLTGAQEWKLLNQWKATEDLQDEYPYFLIGWWGFVPMVIFQ